MRLDASCTVLLIACACTPDYPLCRNESNCRIAEKCVGGKCVQCAGAADCLEGERCAEGVCEAELDRCSTGGDCGEGMVCLFELCSRCFEDAQCGGDRVCEDGTCSSPGKPGEAPGEAPEAAEGDCVLEPVYFEFDSSAITKEAKKTLEMWFLCLAPKRMYTLIGRADSAGDEGYNLSLGLERAKAVKDWLVGQGYPGKGLVVTTAGKDGALSEDDAKDRRVDIL